MNLIELGFKDFSVDRKREAFFMMDVAMKKLHEANLIITDFDPTKVYFKDGIYFFENIVPLEKYYGYDKKEAIFNNVLGLSILAFCSYLPEYNFKAGLLNSSVVCNAFEAFSSCLDKDDKKFYKSILVDGYINKALPDKMYYSDYVEELEKNDSTKGKMSNVLVKATEVGKAYASEDEAAFGHYFFFASMVASLLLALSGIIIYIYNYLG